MDVIYVRDGKVYRVVSTHQESDMAPLDDPEEETLQEGLDYWVQYWAVRCDGCQDAFYDYEVIPKGKHLCSSCVREGK